MSVRDKLLGPIAKFKLADLAPAEQARDTHTAEVKAIRNDGRLTAAGKREAIARSWVKADQAATEVRSNLRAAIAAKQAATARAAFGPASSDPQAVIAHRDAFSRAATLATEADAQQALAQAAICADTGLAAAVAYKAHSEGWTGALSSYAATRPEVTPLAADLDELNDLAADLDNSDGLIAAGVRAALFAPTFPTEFKSSDRAGIERAAGDDGDATD